ncbi:hypothetical protein [Bradyrhizobium sp. Leo170]|uniref:hypothetical protein n=1 Tax=Bradyrhizobium sp. Leo170 TaxID=1571199 RepID=UPI00102E75FE|nr:hypothetical protein [Bradyrhizobium sp. Leo170]TAI67592.1 hypothetical protein CWO89_01890 [Bradyrhizobium sp. Leo170]
MQQIDLIAAKAAKATERRTLAILAYDNACAEPDSANWRAVADLLRLALPNAKAGSAAPKILEPETDPRFAQWADYVIPQSVSAKRLGKSPVIVVTFADGETVRAPAVSLPGKPVNIGRGLRVAIAFYQCRIATRCGGNSDYSACITVPEFVTVTCETTETEYDAAQCNAKSAKWRRGTFDASAAIAESASYPDETEDGALTRADFVKASYRLAVSRLRLAELPEGADARPLQYQIEECELRLAGWTPLQIRARWRAREDAEREAERLAAEAAHDAEHADHASPPVVTSFKVNQAFLSTSRLTLVASNAQVAPSPRSNCILRIAAA